MPIDLAVTTIPKGGVSKILPEPDEEWQPRERSLSPPPRHPAGQDGGQRHGAVREGYAGAFTQGWKVGPMFETSLDDLKAWLAGGDMSEKARSQFEERRDKRRRGESPRPLTCCGHAGGVTPASQRTGFGRVATTLPMSGIAFRASRVALLSMCV